MTTRIEVSNEHVDDVLVASIHFLGQHEEIPERLARLREQVKTHINGEPLCLYHRGEDENPKAARELEVCYPVSEAVEGSEVQSRVLAGGQFLCVTHSGPGEPGEPEWGPAPWWQKLVEPIVEQQIGIEDEPLREVHLPAQGSGERPTIQLQAPLLQPRWLERLAEGLEHSAGEGVRQRVMAGSESLKADSALADRLAWTQGAMERLDAEVDEATRCRVMTGCAHRFPPRRIAKMRAIYRQDGDLDALLELMRADRSLGDRSWYESLEREGDVVYVTKDPFYPEKYREAADVVEKRACACHCTVGRAAIREKEDLSPTFCYCGGGWYTQIWEGILERRVEVEVVQSVLWGDDRCRFAIDLSQR